MKKLTFIICGLLLSITIKAQIPTDNPLRTKVDSIVQKAASDFMKKPGKVGLSVGVIYNGNTYKYNYGETAPGSGKMPTSGTLYEIASITKTFTALLIAHAVSEKKIDLNDDIRKYLKGSYPNLQYGNGQKVKVAYLVSHIARFPRNTATPIDSALTDDGFYKALHAIKLDTLQPYRFIYSNFGYQVLGHILENAYGLTYSQLIKKYITGPLDMPGTQLYPTGQANLIKGYNIDKKTMPETAITYPAAGGLRSNLDDMLKYAEAQLKEQDPVIKQTHHFLFSSDDGGADAMPWAIGRTRDWDYFQREDGGSKGFRTMITTFPEHGVAVVVLSNEADNDSGGQLWDATAAILNGLKKINK